MEDQLEEEGRRIRREQRACEELYREQAMQMDMEKEEIWNDRATD